MPIRRKTMRIEGAKELDRVLKKLPKKIRGKVLRQALMAGAGVIRKAMRQRAPVLTGKLKMSIAARRDRAAERGGASVAVKVGPLGRGFYGMFTEFGTSRQPARPWARPAFEESKRAALDKTGGQLGKAIEREAARLAGPRVRGKTRQRR